MLWLFVQQSAIGVVVGLAVGVAAVQAFKRVQLATPGLYPVASIATAALAFGAADALHGSGFLAVYLAGLALGSATIPARRTRSRRSTRGWPGSPARDVPRARAARVPEPARRRRASRGRCWRSCSCCSRGRSRRSSRASGGFGVAERAVLGWAGLRGAVPVVLATFPVIAGVPHSVEFFDIVFFAVLLSTVAAGRDVRAARAAARRDDRRAARCRERADGDGHDPPARRRRDRGRGRARATRSSGTASATSACRAPRSST